MDSHAFASCAVLTAQDWEERRPQITRLYLNQDEKLKDVMAAVNVQGFKASEKMFKSRITKWGLDKKIKEREARAILKTVAQRNGRPMILKLRGQPVDIPKIENHFKRKGISIEDVLSSGGLPPSGMDIVCRSPSPTLRSPMGESFPLVLSATSADVSAAYEPLTVAVSGAIPARIEAPDALKMVESIFADVRDFMMGSVRVNETPMWSIIHLKLIWDDLSFDFPNPLLCKSYIYACLDDPSRHIYLSYEHACRNRIGPVLFKLLHHTTGAASTYNSLQWRHATYDTALALPSKDGPSPGAVTLARILQYLRLLLRMGEPFGLISTSLANVMIDNLQYLVDRQNAAGHFAHMMLVSIVPLGLIKI